VHLTCRILRHFRAFSSLQVFSAPEQNPRPTHTPLTLAVGQQSIKGLYMKNSLNAFIREILQNQAEPPRQVKYMEVLRVVFKEKSMIFVFFFGLVLALPFFMVLSDVKSSDRIFFVPFGFIPLLIAAVPFYYARRLSNAIKIGKMLFAKVESIEFSQNSQSTLNAVENGFAQGAWRLPEGHLINFQIDQPWAKDIKVGSQVDVLVVSPKFNGIFPLGLHE
jgi:hypothetical protein